MVWLFIDKVMRMVVGLFIGIWVARYLGPAQFGLFSYALSFLGLFGAIAGLGLQGVVVRNIICNPDTCYETLGTAAIMQFIASIFAYALMACLVFWLRPSDSSVNVLVVIVGLTLLFKAADVSVFWFESRVDSKYTVWVQNSCFLGFGVVKIALILGDASLNLFAWAMVAEAMVAAVLLIYMLELRGLRLHKLRFTLMRSKILLRDSWPILLSSISIGVYMRVDQIMIGQVLGDQEVGVFSAATRISEAWYFIPMMIVSSVFPSLLEMRGSNREEYRKRLQHLFDIMVWLSICVALPMTFLSTPIVVMLYGEFYHPSGLVLAIHIWTGIFVSLGIVSGQCFLAENRQILIFQRTIIGAMLNILLNTILIPMCGAVGAAISTLLTQFFVGVLVDFFATETRKIALMKVKAFNPFKILQLIKR